MNRLLVLPVLLLTLSVGNSVFSADEKTSLEYAKMGKKLLSVIQCSVYSEESKYQTERKRFVELGISIGREFITAANDEKITKKDWSKNVPFIYALLMQGPSVDFILGRMWERTVSDVMDKLSKGCDVCKTPDILRKMKKEALFREKNCDLIK